MTDNLRDSALRQAAACAREKYAGEDKRIDKGLLLALNGKVDLGFHETAMVQSESNPEVFYRVLHGVCDCPDHLNAPEFRCKHRWSVIFTIIARDALNR